MLNPLLTLQTKKSTKNFHIFKNFATELPPPRADNAPLRGKDHLRMSPFMVKKEVIPRSTKYAIDRTSSGFSPTAPASRAAPAGGIPVSTGPANGSWQRRGAVSTWHLSSKNRANWTRRPKIISKPFASPRTTPKPTITSETFSLNAATSTRQRCTFSRHCVLARDIRRPTTTWGLCLKSWAAWTRQLPATCEPCSISPTLTERTATWVTFYKSRASLTRRLLAIGEHWPAIPVWQQST